MSYITFSPNQIIYIKDIGYATLINCGSRNTISHKIQSIPSKRQSIYFDPDLFNSDIDSNNSKKSQGKEEEPKVQAKVEKKLVEVIAEKVFEQKQIQKIPEPLRVVQEEIINIIQAKLQGSSGAMIYTSQKNLKKSIYVIIKSFLINHKEQIIVQIQITKTIDSLRKLIFQQLDQQMANYYNVKLFSTNPTLTELNVHTKTIFQYGVKENSKLILTADYAFAFRDVVEKNNHRFKVTLTNLITLTSNKVVEPKKIAIVPIVAPPIPLPPAIDLSVPLLVAEVPNDKDSEVVEQKKVVENPVIQQKIEPKQQNVNPVVAVQAVIPVVVVQAVLPVAVIEPVIPMALVEAVIPVAVVQIVNPVVAVAQQIVQQKAQLQSGPYHARCSIEYSSGRKYWEFKLQKLPLDEQDLVIGVCIPSKDNPTLVDYLWGYQVVSGKKVFIERDKSTNTLQEQSENYGYVAKVNDIIGIFLNFKNKKAILSFYKNSISCGQAFTITLQGQNQSLIPFVNIGGQSQLTLDSKALLPLDSFRLK